MTSQNLQRTTYRDPTSPGNPVRAGSPTRAENALDMDQYYRPLERIHGTSLHGWGVASGLSVSATLNGPNTTLAVLPGVALDSNGQHISLAVGGNAEIGPADTSDPKNLDALLNSIPAPVITTGVSFPIPSTASGDKYLTIQFWETFDTDGFQNQGFYRYFHTPWIRLWDVTNFVNDGKHLVLAKVSLGTGATAGQVTALVPDVRQATDLPVGSIHLLKSATTAPAANVETVQAAEVGVIRASAGGGIDVTVPNPTDEVHLERDDGGNFAKVSLGAEKIVARQGNGTESVVIDTEAGSITTSGPLRASSITARGDLSVDVPSSGSPISAFTLDVDSFQTINNAIASYFLQVCDIGADPPNGLTHFCIRGDGNVGIGTTGPLAALSVGTQIGLTNNSSAFIAGQPAIGGTSGNAAYVGEFRSDANGNTDRLLIYSYRTANGSGWLSTAWRIQSAVDDNFTEIGSNRGYIELNTGAQSLGLSGSGGSTPDLTINSNGNIGIGTSQPDAMLDVRGQASIQGPLSINHAGVTGVGSPGDTRAAITFGATDTAAAYYFGAYSGDTAKANTILGLYSYQLGNWLQFWSPNGNIGIGTPIPQKPLDVAASGGIQISQSGNASSNNELYFQDNGQIRSLDDNHRIIFDRANNILELREYGDLVFSSGATSGTRTQKVTFKSNGNVGVGTTSPNNQLVIASQASFGGNNKNTGSEPIEVQGPGAGVSFYDRTGGATGRWVIYSDQFRGAGTEQLRFSSNGVDHVMINPDSTVQIMGNLYVMGGVKHFVQDHPTDPTKQVVYTSLEGGEAGTYTRGTWKLEGGKAVIDLPEHFSLVTSEDGLSIQLTPRGEWLQLYVVELTTRQVVVQEAQGKSGQFDYLIQGVRKGYEHHEVIQQKKEA